MTDNVVRREVQRRDDPFGIPACFYWTIDEVADWVESIGYGKYKENFRSHFINGRKLLTVDACVLPKMGITHFGDILALAKHIRDQLRIRKNLRDFEKFCPRGLAISRVYPSGKFYPQLSFQGHVHETERIIEARLTYFRKHNMYYSGWSMQKWWDKKLRAEEKRKRAQLYFYTGDERDKRVVIGRSMQDRLREAARRELSYVEKKPFWDKKTIRRTPECPEPVPLTVNNLSSRVIGQLNVTPVRLPKAICKARPAPPSPGQVFLANYAEPKLGKRDQYLPIIFHWEEMTTTKGYPPLKLEKNKC